MRKFILVAVFFWTLVAVAPAHAGGWAVVTVDPLPETFSAGQEFEVGFTILQHGVSPYSSGKSTVVATNNAGQRVSYSAHPSGTPGHHIAKVRFPSAGTWSWSVMPDWFGEQSLGTVEVSEASASSVVAAVTTTVVATTVVQPSPAAAAAPAAPAAVTTGSTSGWTESMRGLLLGLLAAVVLLVALELRSYRRHALA